MSLFLLAAILAVIGFSIVVAERPGWSRAGFVVLLVASILVLAGLLT
jgi:hypothetical protein